MRRVKWASTIVLKEIKLTTCPSCFGQPWFEPAPDLTPRLRAAAGLVYSLARARSKSFALDSKDVRRICFAEPFIGVRRVNVLLRFDDILVIALDRTVG